MTNSPTWSLNIDTLSAVRDIFSAFVENCKLCYSLGQNGITDEMLPRFREANVGLDNLFHPSAVNVV